MLCVEQEDAASAESYLYEWAKDPHKNQRPPPPFPIIMSVIKDYRESKQQDKLGHKEIVIKLRFVFFVLLKF